MIKRVTFLRSKSDDVSDFFKYLSMVQIISRIKSKFLRMAFKALLIWFLTTITFLQAVFQGFWAFCNLLEREMFLICLLILEISFSSFPPGELLFLPGYDLITDFSVKPFLASSRSHHNPLQTISQLIFPCDYIVILRKNNLLRWNSLTIKLTIIKWINSVTFNTFTMLCTHYLHGVPNSYNF